MTTKSSTPATCLKDALLTVGNYPAFLEVIEPVLHAPNHYLHHLLGAASRLSEVARTSFSRNNGRFTSPDVGVCISECMYNLTMLATHHGKLNLAALDLKSAEADVAAEGDPEYIPGLRPSMNLSLFKSVDLLLFFQGKLHELHPASYISTSSQDAGLYRSVAFENSLVSVYAALAYLSRSQNLQLHEVLLCSILVRLEKNPELEERLDALAVKLCEHL